MARQGRRLTGSPVVSLRRAAARLSSTGEPTADQRRAIRRFPMRWTDYYLGLTEPGDPNDPIRRIAWAEAEELTPHPGDRADPVGERGVHPAPCIVRKHPDRVILLLTSRCHVYCRFCFRRSFPDGGHDDPSAAELEAGLDYIAGQPDLREVILSGGDPLVWPDRDLARLIRRLSGIPHLKRLRVHTRAPVHDPARVTDDLAAALGCGLPLWAVLHFDHPRELTVESSRAAARLVRAGVPLLDQTVLLRGVNDSLETLAALFEGLLERGVKPYYLHHPDRVPGAAHFYVSLDRGLELYRGLREHLGGGPALPGYVIDLPDGSGKVPVEGLTAEQRRRLDQEASSSDG